MVIRSEDVVNPKEQSRETDRSFVQEYPGRTAEPQPGIASPQSDSVIVNNVFTSAGSGELTFLDYMKASAQTAIYPEAGEGTLTALSYLLLKLNGEAGEAAEKFAKLIRDKEGRGDLNDRDELIKELGDVMWYLSQLANELDISLADVAQRNLDKLFDRKARGVLGGSGDNR